MAEFNKRYPTQKISKEYNHYGRSWKKENIKLIHEVDGFQFSESFLFLPVLQLFLWGIVFLWAQYIDSSNDKWSVVKIKRERRKSLENFILKKLRIYFLYDLVSWAWTSVHSARRFIGSSHLNYSNLLQYLFFLQYFNLNWENLQISWSCFGRAISLLNGEEVGVEGKGTDYTTLRFKIWLKTEWKKLILKNIHKLDKTLLNSWNMSERTVWYHTK